MPPNCINHQNTIRYVPGSFTTEAQGRKITSGHQKLNQLYSGCPLGDQGRTERNMLYVRRVQMDKVSG